MAFVIGGRCVDVLDLSCVDVCPVDCIYEGLRKAYIHPTECIDCGVCVDACPMDAIYDERSIPDDQRGFVRDSERFFLEELSGRIAPVGHPGGAHLAAAIGVDTPFVASYVR